MIKKQLRSGVGFLVAIMVVILSDLLAVLIQISRSSLCNVNGSTMLIHVSDCVKNKIVTRFYTACHNNVPKIGWRHKGL
jgi:hypothetical protein